MSDPLGPISAGERLSPNRGEPSRNPKAKPPGKPRPPRKKRSFLGFLASFFVTGLYRFGLVAVVLAVLVGGGGFYVLNSDLPSVDTLKDYRPPLESRVYAGNFQLVSELADQHRIYVPYERIPPLVAQAFISAEDRNFWIDPGIDPVAILRAGFTDMMRMGSDRRPLGASTITQQVVKNMLLDNRINFARKVKEAILAVRISGVMSKQKILTIYLNEIYLGSNSYGVAAAAQAYFDRPLSQLSIAQAASLGALPKAPSSYDPFRHPQQALDRRNWVISRMLADGAITPDQAKAATAEPLLPRAGGEKLTVQHAGYFADAVQQQVVSRFGANLASQGGLIIRTSLEPKLQVAAENAVRDGLQRYDHQFGGWHGLVGHINDAALDQNWQADLGKQPTPPGMRESWHLAVVLSVTPAAAKLGYMDHSGMAGASTAQTGEIALADIRWARPLVNGAAGAPAHAMSQVINPGDFVMASPGGKPGSLMLQQIPIVQGALICMDPRTGRVLAMVGGWSHDLSPYNRVTQAQRQPGSSVKPFDYLTAMEQNIQPDASVLDAPFVQQMSDGTTYRPGNFEDNFQGPVPIYHALELSMNLATLNLVRTVGLDNVAKNFESFGIIDQMPPYYPSAIGAIDTTLWKMAAGYAALDEYGRQITPTLIDSVTDPDGKILYQADTGSACDNCAAGNPAQPPQLSYSGQQLADPDSVFQDITMMKGVVLRGTGTPAVVGIKQPVAGKTGTTNNFNDTWFIGFTPGVLAGCWVGYDKPQSLGNDQTGGAVCGPIWNQFMKTALDGQPDIDFLVPPGDSLQQTGGVTEAFKTGQSPGAQSNDNLLAGSPASPLGASTPNDATSGQTGQPTPPPPTTSVDKQLGGLY